MDKGNRKKEACSLHNPIYQAYQLLHIGFTVLPLIAGIDKFFNFLTHWEHYLSPIFNIFNHAPTTMMVMGIVEMISGVGVWLKPKIFSYIVASWLLSIIINLLLLGHFYDIVLLDSSLLIGVLALARLSKVACEKK